VLSGVQEQTAKAIVNIFETDRVLGDYANVTLIPGDAGQLTHGRTQTTLASGGLHELIRAYTGAPGAVLRSQLEPFLPALEAREPALNDDLYFRNLLSAAADDPVMRRTQDDFFDRTKWQPASAAAARDGIASALGTAVVYDSWVHGSWEMLRARTNNVVGVPAAIGERAWIPAYVRERRAWLAGHRRADLRATVYRMDAFLGLLDGDDWDLPLPSVVRGREIDEPPSEDRRRGLRRSAAALTPAPAGAADHPRSGRAPCPAGTLAAGQRPGGRRRRPVRPAQRGGGRPLSGALRSDRHQHRRRSHVRRSAALALLRPRPAAERAF
jgi:chitosanase